MKIAIVSDYYYPQLGGITEHVHGQATELTRRGHEVTLITPTLVVEPNSVDGNRKEQPPFEIKRIGRAWPSYINGSETLHTVGPRFPTHLARFYEERQFDVVHVHNPFGLFLPVTGIVRAASRAPVVVSTIHSVVPERYKPLLALRPLLRRLWRKLSAVVAVSDAVVESMEAHFGDFPCEVIPNGIDTDFFAPGADPLPHLADTRNILFVGRFDPRNGLPIMIDAFASLRRRRDDVRLVVLGDGPLRRRYEGLVPHELRDEVLFEGRVDRLRPRYLASCELLCSPCQLASFGMVVLEAMSAGVPVVASRISGFELLVEDGRQGLLIDPPTDKRQFAAALDHLLDHPKLARRLGAAGRTRAIEEFGWPRVVDQLEALYEEKLAAKRPSVSIPVAVS
jgi:phosphatidylinositol alpha-mannosyltransferase